MRRWAAKDESKLAISVVAKRSSHEMKESIVKAKNRAARKINIIGRANNVEDWRFAL